MKSLWVIFICVCIIVAVITIAWVVFLIHRHHVKIRRRTAKRQKISTSEPTLKQHSKKTIRDIKTISMPKHVNQKVYEMYVNGIFRSIIRHLIFVENQKNVRFCFLSGIIRNRQYTEKIYEKASEFRIRGTNIV